MNTDDIVNELSFIRDMVKKARGETAESGGFFIWIGLISMLGIIALSVIESAGQTVLVVPFMLIITLSCGIVGYITVHKKMGESGARSYPGTICYMVWLACSIPAIIAGILLPFLGIYPWNLSPVLSSLFIGTGLFASGIIFESKAIVWCSFAWWAGAILIPFLEGLPKISAIILMISIGWVLPGAILRLHYRNRRG